MKKLILCLALGLCCLPAAWAQKEYGLTFSSLINDDLTLESAIRIGLENNAEFLAAKEEITIAEQRVQEAKFLYLPQFAVQGTATLFDMDYPAVLPESVANRFIPNNDVLGIDEHHFYGVGVTATQYLYSGGRLGNTLKMARAHLKQMLSKYETVKNNTVLKIKKAFYNLLFAQQQAQLSARVFAIAQKQYRTGLGAWEQLRSRAELATLATRTSAAAYGLKEAEMQMLVSINKELNARIKVLGEFKPIQLNMDLPHLNLWSMEFRPELKSALYALELDNLGIDLALSRRYPDVLLNASYEQLGFNDLKDVNKQVSLAVRLPLSYSMGTQYKQKKAEQKQSALQRSAIEDQIHVQVLESFERTMFWQQEVQARQLAYEEMDSLLNKATKSSGGGIGALQGLAAYEQTVSAYYEAIKESLTARATLEWAVGRDL